jgi:hypothetical protein
MGTQERFVMDVYPFVILFIVERKPQNKPKDVRIVGEGSDIFVMVDGVRVAARGRPGTPEAGTWVTLISGWTVTSNADHTEIEIMHDGRRIN